MALHGLGHVVIGVPNVRAVADFYSDLGLRAGLNGGWATVDGGEQLYIVPAAHRHVVEVGVRVDDLDDIARIKHRLTAMESTFEVGADSLVSYDAGTGMRVRLAVAPRQMQEPREPRSLSNSPGRLERVGARADGVLRRSRVRPRKLGHIVVGSVDPGRSRSFFVDGFGFKVSDQVLGHADFLRCSADHHNLLIQNTPVRFLHHTAWEVDDVDEVGRGATAMLESDPARHVWGLGRHHVGSNFFWYLRDPAGNFTEYYADLDVILDDELWTPGMIEGSLGLWSWGPPPPPSFLKPDDLADLMAGT